VENVYSISGTGYDEDVIRRGNHGCMWRLYVVCSSVARLTNNIVFLYAIADPYRAKKFTVLVSTVSALILTWDAPDVGGLTKYRVTLDGDNSVKIQTPDKDTTTVVFTGLTAGTRYTAGVVTLSGDQLSARIKDIIHTSKSANALF
jgi:hypothetical protein